MILRTINSLNGNNVSIPERETETNVNDTSLSLYLVFLMGFSWSFFFQWNTQYFKTQPLTKKLDIQWKIVT